MFETDERGLSFAGLPETLRVSLALKLAGLFEQADGARVFDALAVDKQQALLLFVERLAGMGLWEEVERIDNVYGEGGVGLSFRARSTFGARLADRERFTTRFALHRDCAEGFFEKGRSQAVLHFLRVEAGADRWTVHFDLHAPMATPLSALRHLWHEKWRGVTPDWRAIKAVFY